MNKGKFETELERRPSISTCRAPRGSARARAALSDIMSDIMYSSTRVPGYPSTRVQGACDRLLLPGIIMMALMLELESINIDNVTVSIM